MTAKLSDFSYNLSESLNSSLRVRNHWRCHSIRDLHFFHKKSLFPFYRLNFFANLNLALFYQI